MLLKLITPFLSNSNLLSSELNMPNKISFDSFNSLNGPDLLKVDKQESICESLDFLLNDKSDSEKIKIIITC